MVVLAWVLVLAVGEQICLSSPMYLSSLVQGEETVTMTASRVFSFSQMSGELSMLTVEVLKGGALLQLMECLNYEIHLAVISQCFVQYFQRVTYNQLVVGVALGSVFVQEVVVGLRAVWGMRVGVRLRVEMVVEMWVVVVVQLRVVVGVVEQRVVVGVELRVVEVGLRAVVEELEETIKKLSFLMINLAR